MIARSSRPGVLSGSASDELVGTTFAPHERVLSARKLWIAFAADVSGSVVVDEGARVALTNRPNSLLPAGVLDVNGAFDDGAVIAISGSDGEVFARGRASLSADVVRQVKGRRTGDLPAAITEVVHRDDLVVLV